MKVFSFILLFFTFNATADSKLAVHLLSYLAQDYGEAVQDGKVKSKSEYTEQLQFVSEVIRVSEQERFPQGLQQSIKQLKNFIDQKKHPREVAKLANSIKWEIIKQYSIATSPRETPDLKLGKEIFQGECYKCHGRKGSGDGEMGVGLDPAPTNFHDKTRMSSISPFQAYTTITLGVPGTGMQSYSDLSEHERWSLAFYVHNFHLQEVKKIELDKKINISQEELAASSDNEILGKYYKGRENQEAFLATIRALPSKDEPASSTYFNDKVQLAIEKFENSFIHYSQKNVSLALKTALEAYLEGVEPIEPLLSKEKLKEIEEGYSRYLSLLKEEATLELVNKQNGIIKEHLQSSLRTNQKSSSFNSALLAFGIVFREALEAVLILVILLSILKKLDAPKANYWVHLGWMSALATGFVIFYLIQDTLISNMGMVEKIEGYVGIVAVALLLYVGLWFHARSNIEQWKKFLLDQVHGHVSQGNMLGLAAISFAAVFREVIETILFIKVLQLDGHSAEELTQGSLGAMIVTVIMGFLIFKFSIKFNIGRLIRASTFLILALAFMLLGKSIHALQLAGVIGTSKLIDFTLPFLGFYGTREVIIAQVLLLVLIIGLLKKDRIKLRK